MATITALEMKMTKTGKPFKAASLDSSVLGKDRFNIFSFHTRYDDVVVGRSFAAEEFQQDGEYIKLRDPDEGVRKFGGPRRGADPVQIAQAQQHKADNIKVAQDNKDYAIRLSGSMGHAVNIVTTFYVGKELTPDEIKTKVINWRDWLLENWDNEKNDSEIPF